MVVIILSDTYYIETNPNKWKSCDDKIYYSKISDDKFIYKMTVGEIDSDFSGIHDFNIYIRKPIYDKLISGEYVVDKESCYYKWPMVYDKNGNFVQPLIDFVCY